MSQDPSPSDRPRVSAPAALGYLCLTVALSVGVVLVVRQTRTTARARVLDQELTAHEARLRAQRFERPAVTDEGSPAGCDSVLDAVQALPDLSGEREALAGLQTLLLRATAAPPPVLALLSRHDAALDGFLRAARCRQVRVSGATSLSAPNPRYGELLRGSGLVALRDRDGDPARCLDSMAAVTRILSDMPYAAGFLGLAMGAVPMEAVASVTLRCARRAEPAAVALAQRRFAALGTPPLPEGEVLVFEGLATVRPIRDIVFSVPVFPTDADSLQAWWHRPRFVQGWAELTEGLSTLPARTVTPVDTLDRLEEVDRILARISPAFAGASTGGRFVERGRGGHARIRLLAVALDALARPRPGPDPAALPMPDLRAPWARDPFTTRDTLRWVRNHTGSFVASSVGPNGLDDRGGNDDILVTVPGPPGTPERSERGHDHGHDHGTTPGTAPGVP